MAIDPGAKAVPAYLAAGATTGAGAATWSLAETAAMFGIVASAVGVVCTIVTTVAVIRAQRRRTVEQEEHHREVERIHRGHDEPGEDSGD